VRVVELLALEELGMGFLRYILIGLLLPFAIALFVVLAIPLLVMQALSVAWFRVRYRGRLFLVFTRRHGWNEFVINNLIPSIEERATPVEIPRNGRGKWPKLPTMIHNATIGLPKPFIARVNYWGVHAEPIQRLLLPMKRYGARNLSVQQQLRDLLKRQLS
jgi:hypothetical protein